MFDVDAFIDECIAANREAEPRLAVKAVLDRAVSQPAAVAAALPPEWAGITRLHVSPDLTIIRVVWAPRYAPLAPRPPHVGRDRDLHGRRGQRVLSGATGTALVESGGKELRERDVCLLGDDAVHAVTNPTTNFAGGDPHVRRRLLLRRPRSEWSGAPYQEQPYDVERTLAYFEAANQSAV